MDGAVQKLLKPSVCPGPSTGPDTTQSWVCKATTVQLLTVICAPQTIAPFHSAQHSCS